MSEVREVPRHYSPALEAYGVPVEEAYDPSIPLPVHTTAIGRVESAVSSAVFMASTGADNTTGEFTVKQIEEALIELSQDKPAEVWLYNMNIVMKELLAQTKKNTTPAWQGYQPKPKDSDRYSSRDVLQALKDAMKGLQSLDDPNDPSGDKVLSIKEMNEHKTDLEHAILSAAHYV